MLFTKIYERFLWDFHCHSSRVYTCAVRELLYISVYFKEFVCTVHGWQHLLGVATCTYSSFLIVCIHTHEQTHEHTHSYIYIYIYIFFIYAICVLLVLHRQWSYCGLESFVLASVWSWWPGRWRLHENRYVCLYVKLNVQSVQDLIYTELAGCQIISACYCEQLAIKIQAI